VSKLQPIPPSLPVLPVLIAQKAFIGFERYGRSVNQPRMDPEIFDDTDTRIQYSGSWVKAGIEENYNHSIHEADDEGSIATFSFTGKSIIPVDVELLIINLLGTSVSVYGTIFAGYMDVASAWMEARRSQNQPTRSPRTTQYHQLFYESPTFRNGW
jgi:hypothetical protein